MAETATTDRAADMSVSEIGGMDITVDSPSDTALDTLDHFAADSDDREYGADVPFDSDTDDPSHVDGGPIQGWKLQMLVTIGTGQVGGGAGEFNYPSGIDVDSEDNLYVLDTHNSRIQKFASDGSFLQEWPHDTFGPTELGTGQGIAVDSDNSVYAVSPHTHVIYKYAQDGTELLSWEMSAHDDWFSSDVPLHSHGLAVDSASRLYVTEYTLGQVQVYDLGGLLLATWEFPTMNGKAPTPPPVWADAPHAISVGAADAVFVTDTYWIREFDPSGKLVKSWVNPASPLPTNPPAVPGAFWFAHLGIEANAVGDLLVCETAAGETGRLVAVSPDGALKWAWGGVKSDVYGSGMLPPPDEFIVPSDLALDQTGAIWVSDLWGHYVRKFDVQHTALR
jgi:sugar lactone lactonase YvrE